MGTTGGIRWLLSLLLLTFVAGINSSFNFRDNALASKWMGNNGRGFDEAMQRSLTDKEKRLLLVPTEQDLARILGPSLASYKKRLMVNPTESVGMDAEGIKWHTVPRRAQMPMLRFPNNYLRYSSFYGRLPTASDVDQQESGLAGDDGPMAAPKKFLPPRKRGWFYDYDRMKRSALQNSIKVRYGASGTKIHNYDNPNNYVEPVHLEDPKSKAWWDPEDYNEHKPQVDSLLLSRLQDEFMAQPEQRLLGVQEDGTILSEAQPDPYHEASLPEAVNGRQA